MYGQPNCCVLVNATSKFSSFVKSSNFNKFNDLSGGCFFLIVVFLMFFRSRVFMTEVDLFPQSPVPSFLSHHYLQLSLPYH